MELIAYRRAKHKAGLWVSAQGNLKRKTLNYILVWQHKKSTVRKLLEVHLLNVTSSHTTCTPFTEQSPGDPLEVCRTSVVETEYAAFFLLHVFWGFVCFLTLHCFASVCACFSKWRCFWPLQHVHIVACAVCICRVFCLNAAHFVVKPFVLLICLCFTYIFVYEILAPSPLWSTVQRHQVNHFK